MSKSKFDNLPTVEKKTASSGQKTQQSEQKQSGVGRVLSWLGIGNSDSAKTASSGSNFGGFASDVRQSTSAAQTEEYWRQEEERKQREAEERRRAEEERRRQAAAQKAAREYQAEQTAIREAAQAREQEKELSGIYGTPRAANPYGPSDRAETMPEATERHNELQSELDQITQNEGFITDPDEANATAARKKEIIDELTRLDHVMGNPERYYDEAGRLGGIARGWASGQAAGYANALGTVAALAGEQDEAGRAIADSSISGYVDNPLAEAYARQDAEAGKLDSLGILDQNQKITEATEGFADEARAKSAVEMAKAKAGLNAFDSAMVDVAKGAFDLGTDAIINLLVPGGGMAAMGTRVFGLGLVAAWACMIANNMALLVCFRAYFRRCGILPGRR